MKLAIPRKANRRGYEETARIIVSITSPVDASTASEMEPSTCAEPVEALVLSEVEAWSPSIYSTLIYILRDGVFPHGNS